MTALAAVQVVSGVEEAAALMSPVRLRLLDELSEPDSAAGLARRLGLARQKVNYHLRELARLGLVEEIEQRRKGNCIERVVRAVARTYVIGPGALGEIAADPDRVEDRVSSAYLVALAARTIGELAVLRERADKTGKKLATLSLDTQVRFKSPEDQSAFAQDLTEALSRLTAKYHDEQAEDGRQFRMVVGVYPEITKPE